MSTVFTAKWGSGEGEYKIWGDSPPIGPGPIAVDNEGNIFIIDHGNDKIKKYNMNGILQQELIVKDIQHRMLLIEGDCFIISRWEDGCQYIESYRTDNMELIGRKHINKGYLYKKLSYVEDKGVYTMIYANGVSYKTRSPYSTLTNSSEPKSEANCDTIPSGTAAANLFRRDYKNHDYVYAAFLFKDASSCIYYHILGKDYDENMNMTLQDYIMKLGPNNEILDILIVPMESNFREERFERYCITSNGDIYYLKINGDLISGMRTYPYSDIYEQTLDLIKWSK